MCTTAVTRLVTVKKKRKFFFTYLGGIVPCLGGIVPCLGGIVPWVTYQDSAGGWLPRFLFHVAYQFLRRLPILFG
jgi:hypothetical protein